MWWIILCNCYVRPGINSKEFNCTELSFSHFSEIVYYTIDKWTCNWATGNFPQTLVIIQYWANCAVCHSCYITSDWRKKTICLNLEPKKITQPCFMISRWANWCLLWKGFSLCPMCCVGVLAILLFNLCRCADNLILVRPHWVKMQKLCFGVKCVRHLLKLGDWRSAIQLYVMFSNNVWKKRNIMSVDCTLSKTR